ncbi:hypothetical protein HDK64DRAFT_36078 [Phyllosticta capitalensis]
MLLHSPGCQKLPKKGEILRRRQRTVDTFMDSCHWSGVVESAVCPNDRDAEVKVCVCRCAGTTSSSNGWFFQCPGPLLPSNTVEYWHKKTMRHTSRIFSAQQFFLSNKISSLPPPQRSRPCCPGSLPHYDESVRCPLSLIPSATAKQRGRRTKMKRCCTLCAHRVFERNSRVYGLCQVLHVSAEEAHNPSAAKIFSCPYSKWLEEEA